eukprot:776375-Prymnesium_polylepis.1
MERKLERQAVRLRGAYLAHLAYTGSSLPPGPLSELKSQSQAPGCGDRLRHPEAPDRDEHGSARHRPRAHHGPKALRHGPNKSFTEDARA